MSEEQSMQSMQPMEEMHSMEATHSMNTSAVGHLYTQTNETQNGVIHYLRSADGTITEAERCLHRRRRVGRLQPDHQPREHAEPLRGRAQRHPQPGQPAPLRHQRGRQLGLELHRRRRGAPDAGGRQADRQHRARTKRKREVAGVRRRHRHALRAPLTRPRPPSPALGRRRGPAHRAAGALHDERRRQAQPRGHDGRALAGRQVPARRDDVRRAGEAQSGRLADPLGLAQRRGAALGRLERARPRRPGRVPRQRTRRARRPAVPGRRRRLAVVPAVPEPPPASVRDRVRGRRRALAGDARLGRHGLDRPRRRDRHQPGQAVGAVLAVDQPGRPDRVRRELRLQLRDELLPRGQRALGREGSRLPAGPGRRTLQGAQRNRLAAARATTGSRRTAPTSTSSTATPRSWSGTGRSRTARWRRSPARRSPTTARRAWRASRPPPRGARVRAPRPTFLELGDADEHRQHRSAAHRDLGVLADPQPARDREARDLPGRRARAAAPPARAEAELPRVDRADHGGAPRGRSRRHARSPRRSSSASRC